MLRQIQSSRWLLLFLVLSQVPQSADADDPPATTEEAEPPRAMTAAEILARPTELEFIDLPLEEGLAFLSDHHKFPIFLDRTALQAAEIDPAQPVTLSLSGVSLRSALKVLLEPRGLGWRVDGNRLVVTTAARAAEPIVQVHPLRGLGPATDEMAGLLQTTVGRGTWDMDGGTGVLRPIAQTLVVRHQPVWQHEISQLLSDLRSLKTAKPVVGVVREAAPTDLERRLGLPVDIEFTEISLRDGLKFLADEHHLPLMIDEATLALSGISLDALIAIQLEGLRLESVLHHLLDPVGAAFLVEDEVVKVLPLAVLRGRSSTRVYDLRPLIQGRTTQADIEDAIRHTIHQESWNYTPEGGVMMALPQADAVVIQQSPVVHAEIQATLARMHERFAARPPSPAAAAADQPLAPPATDPPVATPPDALAAAAGDKPPAEPFPLRWQEPQNWEFVEVPLTEVLAFLRDQNRFPILLDTAALQDAGIDPALAISSAVEKTPFDVALTGLLEPHGLTWVFRHEAVIVTTPDRARVFITEVYDITSLIPLGVVPVELADTIIHTLSPNDWDEEGPGAVRMVNGLFIVRQTFANHQRLQWLLHELHKELTANAAAP